MSIIEPLLTDFAKKTVSHCPDCGEKYLMDKGHSCNKQPFSSKLWKRLEKLRSKNPALFAIVFDKYFPNPKPVCSVYERMKYKKKSQKSQI